MQPYAYADRLGALAEQRESTIIMRIMLTITQAAKLSDTIARRIKVIGRVWLRFAIDNPFTTWHSTFVPYHLYRTHEIGPRYALHASISPFVPYSATLKGDSHDSYYVI